MNSILTSVKKLLGIAESYTEFDADIIMHINAVFLVLQQIEGNLIYPHVVGGSVGLPSIWVLVAVIIGGDLMGILGMLIFVPLSSVLYALVKEFVLMRLREKGVAWEKYGEPYAS